MCLLSDDTIEVREKKKKKKGEGVMLVLAVESPAISIWLMRRLFFSSPPPPIPRRRWGDTHTIAALYSHVARSRQWIRHGGTVALSVVDCPRRRRTAANAIPANIYRFGLPKRIDGHQIDCALCGDPVKGPRVGVVGFEESRGAGTLIPAAARQG